MSKARQLPDDRRRQILFAALLVAQEPGGYSKLTREAVAQQVPCSEGLVSQYFGTMIAFKRTIVRAAIADQNLSIIAQALAIGDRNAQKATKGLKAKALATLAG